MEVWPGQTTAGIFIIGSISKTNNNILLTTGQSHYYNDKKGGMSLVVVVVVRRTKRVMQVWTNWNASSVFTLYYRVAQQEIIEAVGSLGQVIKMFWDTAHHSVTSQGGEEDGEGGEHLRLVSAGGRIISVITRLADSP